MAHVLLPGLQPESFSPQGTLMIFFLFLLLDQAFCSFYRPIPTVQHQFGFQQQPPMQIQQSWQGQGLASSYPYQPQPYYQGLQYQPQTYVQGNIQYYINTSHYPPHGSFQQYQHALQYYPPQNASNSSVYTSSAIPQAQAPLIPYNPQAYQQRNVFYLAVPVIPVLVPMVYHDTRYFVLSGPPRQQPPQPSNAPQPDNSSVNPAHQPTPVPVPENRTREYKPLLPPRSETESTGSLIRPYQSKLASIYNPPRGSVSELKTNIYDCLTSSMMIVTNPLAAPSSVHVNSFLYELSDNRLSLAQSGETHLNWLIEFVTSDHYLHGYQENVLDYFKYIKEIHLDQEIDYDERIRLVIMKAIHRLIKHRCMMPEVISALIPLIKNSIYSNGYNCKSYYEHLLFSIDYHGNSLSANGFERYLTVIEASIEHIPIPESVVLLQPDEDKDLNILRLILHYAPLYRFLMGFDASKQQENLDKAIKLMNLYSDRQHYDPSDLLTNFHALNIMLQRSSLHMINSKQEVQEFLYECYEMVAAQLGKIFNDSHLYDLISNEFNHLLDIFINFYASNPDFGIDFTNYVTYSYECHKEYTFVALHQIAIYLSVYEVKYSVFKAKCIPELTLKVDSEFLLVLEALIAAVDDVDLNPAAYETWEPSGAFLILQDEIFNLKVVSEENKHIVSDFLFFAAKIFLSRRTGCNISFFASKNPAIMFSWSDAIDFVNFYLEKYFSRLSTIESKFCQDLAQEKDRNGVCDFSLVWKVYETDKYVSKIAEAESELPKSESEITTESEILNV